MTNPWMGRFSEEASAPKKVSLKRLATGNGKPGKPSLAGLKKKPLPQKQTKEDFYSGGLLYWNATVTNGVKEIEIAFEPKPVRPVGTVDVSNGDQTYTFHNRYGSWMADVGEGRMAELARVANMLGTNMGQVEMYHHVRDRFEAELKVKGYLTIEQQQRKIEERAATQRSVQRSRATRQKNQTANPWMGRFG